MVSITVATRTVVRYISCRFLSGSGKVLSEEEKVAEIFTYRKLSERNRINLHARDRSQRRNPVQVQGVLQVMLILVAQAQHLEHLPRKHRVISFGTKEFEPVLQPLVLLWDGI
ncbi:uncharacterized protein LOC120168045 [Hibiscus syriacus]|uniref:uncharacterized protein LOC120168045 n=1 Tax=Hibiscus syriacus TaxID=106335 RepID=UPI001921E5B3|nr:uncharacterized protein LOC120168045 [Hibiscus syriacus]